MCKKRYTLIAKCQSRGKRQGWRKKARVQVEEDVGVTETQEGRVGGEIQANGKGTAGPHQKVVDERRSEGKKE